MGMLNIEEISNAVREDNNRPPTRSLARHSLLLARSSTNHGYAGNPHPGMLSMIKVVSLHSTLLPSVINLALNANLPW